MKTVIYLLIVLFLPFATATAGLFDLAEYRRVSYDASIGEEFLWFAPDLDLREVTIKNIDDFEKRIVANIPDESLPNYVFVTSKGGQKFACSLPDVEELKKTNSPRSSKNPKIYGDALAASFYVDKCVKLRGNHWWAYTLCRGQTVEQTHGEPGQEGYVKNILGLYDGSLTMPSYQESTEDRLLYVEELYTSGTFCDLEEYREPRKTTVRYECDSQLSTNEAYVSSVAEVRPCQYLMIIKVGTLCHYPEFLPASQANTKNIGCQPYLSKKDVRLMLERQLEETRRQDRNKKQVALSRKEFHRSLARYNAITKSSRNMYIKDDIKKKNAEMDYHAAHFNLLIASLELEGEPITKKKQDYMWKLFSTADVGDYMFYADYDSISDENRAHLWYYFNDPTWPKDQFPKDILATAVQNAYIDEVREVLQSSYNLDYDKNGFAVGIREFLKTGVVLPETNLVIPAMDVYDTIIDINTEFSMDRYAWLQLIYLRLSEDREEFELIEKIIESIMKPQKKRSYFPLGNISEEALSYVIDEVWDDLIEISENGPNSEIFQVESNAQKGIYEILQIIPYPKDQPKRRGKHRFNYKIFLPEDKLAHEMETEYFHLLAPIYQLLSINWFHRKNENYFHVSPTSRDFLKPSDSDDYKFHYNLARDMGFFGRMLAFTTVAKIKDFENWRDGVVDEQIITDEDLQNSFMEKPLVIDEETMDTAAFVLYDRMGPTMVNAAKRILWKKKVEGYKIKYWVKDRKLRKQAQSMQGLMKDLLSVKDDSDAFVSLGGNSGSSNKKKEIFDEKFLKKLSMLESADDLDVDSIKESIYLTDDDFSNLDDMQHVLDLLEKAGLSKKTEVQIKMFDADGNEVQSDELDAVAKSLLDVADTVNRMKDSERAYLKKLLEDIQAGEEEEKD
ncbi:hypothetical protein CRE_04761 [Caenorhabditis remanei]|uniref:MRH domain-containing protein n=1 Tax=Caenorhabditis remanei TaxID=31234 RepID=E3LZ41_CAERE|nr:hypothetical protein CRE_04761 [Caenorhabditis remanei]